MSLIKKQFVKQVLQDESKRFKKNQGAAMRKLLTFHTGRTIASRQFKVKSGDEMDGRMEVNHSITQRFLDIKKKGSKRRKRLPIHNKYVFGHYYSTARRLMYEFTDDVANEIRKQFS